MYNDIGDILETISMIRDKNLDVRTTTRSKISLSSSRLLD